ncbi:MAG: TonB-dependent receptor [Pseudomonadota bacterium]
MAQFRILAPACAFLSSIAPLALVTAAKAQSPEASPNGVIDSIVVSAQKRRETLEEVPISIKAYTNEEIEKLQINSITDIALLTPSVSLNEGLNPLFTSITVRGVGNIGGEQATSGIYLDGFELSANSSAGLGIQYDDIERIEVLRGPQGTTFGRNVVAGAISVTTKEVGEEVSGYAEIRGENFGGVGARGAVNLPVLADTLGFRVAGFVDASNGNIENIGSAGGRNDFTRFGGRLTTNFNPFERLTIKSTVGFDRLDQGLENFVADGFLESSLLPIVDIIDLGLNPFLPPGSLPAGPATRFPDQNDTVEFNTPTSFDFETFIATANVSYEFDNMDLVWVSGYVANEINRFEDTDLSEIDAIILDQQNNSEFASTELRLQSKGDGRLNWTAGLYAASAEFITNSGINTGSQIDQVYLLPGGTPLPVLPGGLPITFPFDIEIFPNNLTILRNAFESDEQFYAAFGEIEFEISNTLSIFGGLRFNHDRIKERETDPIELVSLNELLEPEFTETVPLPPDLQAFQGGFIGNLILFPATFEGETQNADFERLTWRAGMKWRPADDINLYAIVSTGYRPGGIQLVSGLAPPTFGSETLRNYEVGIKTFLFDRRANINLALFYMDWRDVQISTRLPGSTFGFTDNVGEADVLGLEFEFVAQPAEGVTLGGGLAFIDTQIKSFIDADGFDRAGFDLPNAAELTANVYAEYQRPVFGAFDGFVRASLIHNSEQLPDFITGGIDRPTLERWRRVDLRLGVASENNIRIEIYAENLLNAIYATGKDLVGFGLAGQYVVSPPRRIGGRFTKSF